MSSPVSLLGLGAMGAVLASTFQDKGYKTTIWNRSPAKAAPLIEKGALLASTATECIQASKLTILCLLDNKAVHETLAQAISASALSGRTIVNFTNGTPDEGRKTAELVTSNGGKYIHGAIMTVPAMVGQPESLFLYSGDEAAFTPIEGNELSILGSRKFLSADAGSASLYDLALLSGMYGLISGYLHALTLVEADGKTGASDFTSTFIPFATAIAAYLGIMGKQIDERDYSAGGSNLAMQKIAIEHIVETSKAQGTSAEMIRPIQQLVQQRVDGGRGGEDISSVIELMRGIGKKN